MSVTFTPRSWYSEANSTPTAPAPTTMTSFGSESARRASSEVMIRLPSISRPGSDLTRDPVAMMTSVPLRTRYPRSTALAVLAGHLDLHGRRAVEPAATLDPGDLVLVDEALQARPETLHDLVAALGHADVIDYRVPGVDAELLGMPDPLDEGRRLEQRLRRDAAGVEAGTADLGVVDEGDLQPELGRPERGGVATGARAEDDEIEVVGGADGHRHDHTARSVRLLMQDPR